MSDHPSRASQAPPRLDELLCHLIHSTGFAFNRLYRKPLEKLGLTYPQYLVLVVLWAEDGLTVGELGDRLRLDSGTLTPLLKRLEAQGVVTRRRSTQDERRVVISLTEKGDKLRTVAAEVMQCVSGALDLPAGAVVSLTEGLRELRTRLDQAAR